MSQLNIAVAQFAATRDVAANTATAVDLIERAAETAQLVILPENSMYSDAAKEAPDEKYFEPLDGPFVTRLRAAAKNSRIDVIAGITETNPDDARPFNTLVHIDREGNLAGTYRKVHLYDAFGYRESDSVTPAPISAPLLFECNGLTIGAATCYDLRFPEIFRWLVDGGADVIALPADWIVGPMKELHWETLVRARAIENTIYMAACGQTGPIGSAQSVIIDPMGTVIASAGESAGSIAVGTVSKTRIDDVRRSNPSLVNRAFSVVPGRSL